MIKQGKSRWYHGAFTLGLLTILMLLSLTRWGLEPQLPLLMGCALAAVAGLWAGHSWQEVLQGAAQGVSQTAEAVLILLSIGILTGIWLEGGVVPGLIWYGLRLLHPRIFLPAASLLCAAVSLALGSWGTVGSLGLAFMGMGQALGLDPALTAGAVVSGAYVGDKLSPLTDGTNLAAAVSGARVAEAVRQRLPLTLGVFGFSLLLYAVLGANAESGGGEAAPLMAAIEARFSVSPFCLLPLVLMLICLLLKLPALPAILAGILGGLLWGLMQGARLADLLQAAYSGGTGGTGLETLDALLTSGGLSSMYYSLGIILIAMAFGGILRNTGQAEALLRPLSRRIRRGPTITGLTVVLCVFCNLLLPDQYLGISLPGQLLEGEYDRLGIRRPLLAATLGAGGAVTSALIPWNTCGAYIFSVLGVSPLTYGPRAFFCLLLPLASVAFAPLYFRRHPLNIKEDTP